MQQNPMARRLRRVTLGVLLVFVVTQVRSQVSNEFRVDLNWRHPLHKGISGYGEIGFEKNAMGEYQRYYLEWPGVVYSHQRWLQLWFSTRLTYVNNVQTSDRDQLRPSAGIKLFLPNRKTVTAYNFSRYELLATYDRGSHQWKTLNRIRTRFGAEIPLTRRDNAWNPKTFYGIADIEPVYQFEPNGWSAVQLRCGLGFITHDIARIEFLYGAELRRTGPSTGLDFDMNRFRLNLKVSLKRGLLGHIWNP